MRIARARVFRIGRAPRPWDPPRWENAKSNGTFANRFDDPAGSYRVLYASSQRLGCFLETLARFRLDLRLRAELAEIAGHDDFFPLGEVPLSWLNERRMGEGTIHGDFAPIYTSEFVSQLRLSLAKTLVQLGMDDLDNSHLQGPVRELTQAASRAVYEQRYDGIAYYSKYGLDLVNWAIFEPFMLLVAELNGERISMADPDLQRALNIHQLQIR